MVPTFTLAEAQAAIHQALRLNASAPVDRVGRIALDARDRTLRRWLAQAEREAASTIGCKHLFGANWKGPALDSLLRDCAFHRDAAKVGAAA